MKKITIGAFKLHMDHIHYTVDEELRTVTAHASVYVAMPWEVFRLIHFETLPAGLHPYSAITVHCTTKCAPEDEFQEELGKKIALAGLENKAYKILSGELSDWRESLMSTIAQIDGQTNAFNNRAYQVMDDNVKYINELTGRKNESVYSR